MATNWTERILHAIEVEESRRARTVATVKKNVAALGRPLTAEERASMRRTFGIRRDRIRRYYRELQVLRERER